MRSILDQLDDMRGRRNGKFPYRVMWEYGKEHEILEKALRIAYQTMNECYDMRELESIEEANRKIEALFGSFKGSSEEMK